MSSKVPSTGSSTPQAEPTRSPGPTTSDKTHTLNPFFYGGGGGAAGGGGGGSALFLTSPTVSTHTDRSSVSYEVPVCDESIHEGILHELYQTYEGILPGLKTHISLTGSIEKESKKGERRTNITYSVTITASNGETVSTMDRVLQLQKKEDGSVYAVLYNADTRTKKAFKNLGLAVETTHKEVSFLRKIRACFQIF